MKRIFLSISFFFLCLVLVSSYSYDKTASRRGAHVLTSMWKDYEEAVKADLPQKMMEISAEIKQEAFRRHLPWDFYDASLKHVNAGVSRNWKLRDSLNTAAAKGFEDFGDPLLLLMYDMKMWKSSPDSLYNYVQSNASRLKRSESRDVYTGCNPFSLTVLLSSILKPCSESVLNALDNDYEFALWSVLLRQWDRGKVAAKAIDALKAAGYDDVEAKNGFAEATKDYHLAVEIDPKYQQEIMAQGCPWDVLCEILSQDPRPAYQNDPERIYHLDYAEWAIDFIVNNATVCVKKCTRK